ncbi:Uncharacterised protein [Mycoplasmopsis bovigenitalium]|uniref:Uncharacterized protein n=1 Tax=Mycoplasmopsis bovigenitalium TaxID=2112 RepID=A0A449A975_9BACT|nr:hypothetical protein [Mycoplasmopsis bovigenitalium]VEU60736.1 Uncharacterised protein [Mycoplasmopsis bovigenitalium]
MSKETNYLITACLFLGVIGIIKLISLLKNYRDCFARDIQIKEKARNQKPEWKIILSTTILSIFGLWVIISFWLVN